MATVRVHVAVVLGKQNATGTRNPRVKGNGVFRGIDVVFGLLFLPLRLLRRLLRRGRILVLALVRLVVVGEE
jgi:hypothetical protein